LPLAEVAESDGEPEVRDEKVEGGVVVGPVGAPFLLGLDELRAIGIDRLAVVRDVVEVDGDIDRSLG
jgi:hypothetical protein